MPKEKSSFINYTDSDPYIKQRKKKYNNDTIEEKKKLEDIIEELKREKETLEELFFKAFQYFNEEWTNFLNVNYPEDEKLGVEKNEKVNEEWTNFLNANYSEGEELGVKNEVREEIENFIDPTMFSEYDFFLKDDSCNNFIFHNENHLERFNVVKEEFCSFNEITTDN